jgi:3-oxoacyl-[acyl-carrier-protein] synthase III
MRRASITAIGHFLPEDRLTNKDLERMVETNDDWIRTRTGISERRILRDPGKATAYMAARAAENVLKKRGISAEEVDCIIVGTVTPDMFFPSTACIVQNLIGAKNAWGFDLSAACSGFLFSLSTGMQFIETGKHDKVLVIGADKMSTIIDYTDRNTCVLFGDGAGAVLLEASTDENGIYDTLERVDGSGSEMLCMWGGGSLNPPSHDTVERGMHYLHQEGRSVFKFAVEGMAEVAAEIMRRNNLKGEDIRYLVPHQANQRIIDATARRMGVGMDKVMFNIDRYGNTTAATIPLCLADWEHELRPGDNLIIAAFGGGFTWGAAYLKWAYDGSQTASAGSTVAEDSGITTQQAA